MGPADIHQQRRDIKQQSYHKHLGHSTIKYVIANAYANSQTTLPSQHKRTLRGTSLTMATQFDEEQQEASSHQA